MALFDAFGKPRTQFQILSPDRIEWLDQAYRGRDVIPSQRARDVDPLQIPEEMMERYFQVKPNVFKPRVSIPGGATALLIISALAFLFDLAFFRAFFPVLLLSLIGIAAGLIWVYNLYAPVRNYLFPLEAYLLRDTITRDTFNRWKGSRKDHIEETTALRLNTTVADLRGGPRTGGSQNIHAPRHISGYIREGAIPSRTTTQYNVYLNNQGGNKALQVGKPALSVEQSSFKVADHVEYLEYVNGVNQVAERHWRITGHLYVAPRLDALVVYKTSINAVNRRIVEDETSEYFYQSVLGLRTKFVETEVRIRTDTGSAPAPDLRVKTSQGQVHVRTDAGAADLRVQIPQVEFSLLIGHGYDSGSSIVTIYDEELRSTIQALREAIRYLKERALRQEVASGSKRTRPDFSSDTSSSGERAGDEMGQETSWDTTYPGREGFPGGTRTTPLTAAELGLSEGYALAGESGEVTIHEEEAVVETSGEITIHVEETVIEMSGEVTLTGEIPAGEKSAEGEGGSEPPPPEELAS
ncbi:MAG TPA: HPP family protein [Ktedonobacterales bacterium]|jgi:hypothetical protein